MVRTKVSLSTLAVFLPALAYCFNFGPSPQQDTGISDEEKQQIEALLDGILLNATFVVMYLEIAASEITRLNFGYSEAAVKILINTNKTWEDKKDELDDALPDSIHLIGGQIPKDAIIGNAEMLNAMYDAYYKAIYSKVSKDTKAFFDSILNVLIHISDFANSDINNKMKMVENITQGYVANKDEIVQAIVQNSHVIMETLMANRGGDGMNADYHAQQEEDAGFFGRKRRSLAEFFSA